MLHMYYIFIYWVLYPTRGKHLTSVYNICPLFFNTKVNSNLENVEGNIKKFLSPLSFPAFVPNIKACMPYCKFLSSLWKIPAERQLHAFMINSCLVTNYLLWNKSLTSIWFMSCVLFLQFINSCRMTNFYWAKNSCRVSKFLESGWLPALLPDFDQWFW